jgi:hydroxypyruvate reductase
MHSTDSRKQALNNIWLAAIDAVAGRQAVKNALANDSSFHPDLILAVGKAAAAMCLGALDSFPGCEALVVTKYDHADAELRSQKQVMLIESAHPLPDQKSLEAGNALFERINAMAADSRVLLLVSGGASSLAEALPEDMSLADWQALTDEMLSTGKTIGQINKRRKQTSLIKDGKLVAAFHGVEIRVYAISDVEGDDIGTIGSGIGDCHRASAPARASVIASNQIARQHAQNAAAELGLEVRQNEETLYHDLFVLAPKISARLRQAQPGVYIWGGEPTVILPRNPGRGGRNQSLALALAKDLAGREDITVLVAGTDGSDGPTDAAGGLVDGNTWSDPVAAEDALDRADAGSYLEQHDSLFVTGPTNTNVMDLVIAIID